MRGTLTLAFIAAALILTPQADSLARRAQSRQPSCPTIRLNCPETLVAGEPGVFTVEVKDASPGAVLTYEWSVSSGFIESGQGTTSITVNRSGAGGQTTTATVKIGGLDEECEPIVSCTPDLARYSAPARKFDEVGSLSFDDEQERLNKFALELVNDPGAMAYLIAYAGRRAYAGEAEALATRAKDYLVKNKGVSGERIVVMDGGHREERTMELWIVPTGAPPPFASPTIDGKDVEIIKAPEKRRGEP